MSGGGKTPTKFENELLFNCKILDERSLAYICQVHERLKTDRESLQGFLPPIRTGSMVMMMRPLIIQQVGWINQKIRLKEYRRSSTPLSEFQFYRFFALLFWSHRTGISIETSIMLLRVL